MRTSEAVAIIHACQEARAQDLPLPETVEMAEIHAYAHMLRRDYLEPHICENGHPHLRVTETWFDRNKN